MAFIQPSGQVVLLKGYHGDKNYNHTVRFNNLTEQQNYFLALRPTPQTDFSFTNQQYAKYTKNSIRIPKIADHIYGCNYMMFRNTNFANKWFYAFIDKIEYVNNNMCEVFYTIDVIQTYWFDFDMGQCFVEREHTSTDNLFEHTVKEDLNTDEFTITHVEDFTQVAKNLIILYYVNQEASGGEIRNNTFTGLRVKAFDNIDENVVDDINDFISAIIALSGQIVAMYQTPYPYSSLIKWYEHTIPFADTLDGYTPKNKKLFSGQFNEFCVSNNTGSCARYKPEFLTTRIQDGKLVFDLIVFHTVIPVPVALCVPMNYKNQQVKGLFEFGGNSAPFDYSVVLSEFPICSWVSDSFQTWLAQNRNSYVTGLLGGVATTAISGAIDVASSNYLGAAKSLVGGAASVAGMLATLADKKNMPDAISSQSQTPNLSNVIGRIGFTVTQTTVKREIAEIIDGYFTMYGYKTLQLKQPNIKGGGVLRPCFNYVQTKGAILHPKSTGNLCADDEQTISEIFDRGITFWEKNIDVGDYSVDNSPL